MRFQRIINNWCNLIPYEAEQDKKRATWAFHRNKKKKKKANKEKEPASNQPSYYLCISIVSISKSDHIMVNKSKNNYAMVYLPIILKQVHYQKENSVEYISQKFKTRLYSLFASVFLCS